MIRITQFVVLLFVFSLTVLLSQQSLAVGFSKGNTFEITELNGTMFLFCPQNPDFPSGPNQQFVNCREDLWTPGATDYFVGPAGVKADSVTLVAVRQDGSRREKVADYDSAKGRTEKRINLAISTLTQRPLLRVGSNQVSYVMKSGATVVATGEFTAEVKTLPSRQCQTSSVWAPSAFDCQNPTFMCNRYFEDQNYCQ